MEGRTSGQPKGVCVSVNLCTLNLDLDLYGRMMFPQIQSVAFGRLS